MAAVDAPIYASDFLMLRAGVEARPCLDDGILCAVVGVDAATRHQMLMDDYASGSQDDVVLVPRAGADIGGKHIRFNASAEMSIAQRGTDGVALVTGFAYRW